MDDRLFNEADGQTPTQTKAPLSETTPRMDDRNKIESTRPGADRRRASRGPRPTERTKALPFVPRSVLLQTEQTRRARVSGRVTRTSFVDGCATSIGHAPRVGRNVRSTDCPVGVSLAFGRVKTRGEKNGHGREPTDLPRSRSTFSRFLSTARLPSREKTALSIFDGLLSHEPSKRMRVKKSGGS